MSNQVAVSTPRSTTTFRTHRWIDGISLALIGLAAAAIAVSNVHTSYDDAFITYRYASNFARGLGFVYNPGEWYMGTTAPLYGLLLGVLGILNPDAIPLIGGWMSGLSLLLLGAALYIYGRMHGQWFCGLLAGLFTVTNPLLPAMFGGEMLFQTALIMCAFVLYRRERTVIAAVLLALGMLTRPDGIVAAGVVGLHFLITRRRFPWRELLAAGSVLLPFVVLALVYYGALTPGTLNAKRAQIESGLWPSFIQGSIEWLRGYTFQGGSTMFPDLQAAPHMIRYVLFIVLGIPTLLWFRFWLLPLAWVGLYTLGYHILGVPFYGWYLIPIVVGLIIVAACGVAGVVELSIWVYNRLRMAHNAPWATTALRGVCLLALLPGVFSYIEYSRQRAAAEPTAGKQLYINTGHWLSANTPPDASIGYFEIGFMGYYARRAIIDPVGLVNPGVADNVARGDLTWAYREYRPDYIVHNQYIFVPQIGKMLAESWFTQQYREIARVNQQGAEMIIYQRTTP